MSKFSEHLEQCIIDSGMTENQLARISGFNRSYVALMKNGQRVSPDAGKMRKLIDVLNLSPHEFDQLWTEYARARMGDEIYERNRAIIDLMESFGNISHTSIKSFYSHEIPDIKTVENRMDLEYMMKAVMEREAMKQNAYIRIVMQPDISAIRSILPGLCKNNRQLKIDHIVCMNHNAGNESNQEQLYNIKMLQFLMPMVIFSNNRNYRIYHFYDSVKSHFSETSLLPYLVLTQEYVICMNTEMTKGIIYREKEFIDLYTALFEELKKSCKTLLNPVEHEADIYKRASGIYLGDIVYTMAQQPCFGMLNMDGPIRKYYRRGNDSYRTVLENMLKVNEKQINSGQVKVVSYCTRSGLRRFAEDGIMDEFSYGNFRVLEINDRKDVLNKLLDLIRQEKYELYLLDEYGINFPKELFISSYGITDATLMYLSENGKAGFTISEISFTKIIYEFFQDIVKSPQSDNNGEAVYFIQQLIQEMDEDKK